MKPQAAQWATAPSFSSAAAHAQCFQPARRVPRTPEYEHVAAPCSRDRDGAHPLRALAELPGALNDLAKAWCAKSPSAGAAPVVEGEQGDRFYVVLSGVMAVSQSDGRRATGIRPSGEVALAMGVPRTASVRAMTPSVVASCDKATFDEFIRPLFANDD